MDHSRTRWYHHANGAFRDGTVRLRRKNAPPLTAGNHFRIRRDHRARQAWKQPLCNTPYGPFQPKFLDHQVVPFCVVCAAMPFLYAK